jgi:type IV secretory pathway TrbF-like protein
MAIVLASWRCSASASSAPASPMASSRADRSSAQARPPEPACRRRHAAAGAVAGRKVAGGAVASACCQRRGGTSRAAGGASTMAYALGSAGKSGAAAVASGLWHVARAVGDARVGAATSPLRKAGDGMKQSFREGSRAAITNTGGTVTADPTPTPPRRHQPQTGPARLGQGDEGRQTIDHGATSPPMPSSSGDSHGGGSSINTSERTDPCSTTLDPLRQDPRARDALPARRAGLGRPHRLGPRAGANWRLHGLRLAGLSAGLAAGLVWQSARGTIVPWVVQVDKLGEAQAVAPADRLLSPTDPQIAFHLARFIEQVRAIPADPIIVRQNWLRAYDFTTDQAARCAQRLCPRQRSLRQGRQGAGRRRRLQRHPRFADSFRVAWIERRYQRRQPRRNRALDRDPDHRRPAPRTPDALRKNPLGIFVNAINWSKELGS